MKYFIRMLVVAALTVLSTSQLFAHGNIEMVLLEGETNPEGRFSIEHSFYAGTDKCRNNTIVGASAAIRSGSNGAWYLQVDRNNSLQSIAIGSKKINGYFNLPDYEVQPVKVVLFIKRSSIC